MRKLAGGVGADVTEGKQEGHAGGACLQGVAAREGSSRQPGRCAVALSHRLAMRADLAGRGDVEQNRALTVGDVMVRNLVTARPEESLRVAVHRMSALGLRQLPVVAGDLPARPLGLLRRSDILAAYERMQGSFTS